ncbi:MAG: hypothetical protein AB7G62_10870 [Magnetospirillum sp.]
MTLQHSYGTNGISDAFAFSFPIDQEADIQVLIDNIEQNSGFTVHGAASPGGGVVVFLAAPSAGKTLLIRHRGRSAVSSADASSGYLSDKLVAGAGISLTPEEDGEGRQVLVVTNTDTSNAMVPELNLADLTDAAAARSNLDVYSTAQTDAAISASSDLDLKKASNLADLTDKSTARTNLGVYSTAQVDATISASSDLDLKKAQNLDDLTDKPTARTNLGVYSSTQVDAAISASSDLDLKKAQNLDDLADKPTARTNLGVYSTTQVDATISASSDLDLKKAQNLDDLTDKPTARTNLGIYSTTQVDAAISASADLDLKKASNLGDLQSTAAARTNLGLDNVAYLNVTQDWSKPQRNQALFTGNVGGSVTLDMGAYQNFELGLSADVTFANPTIVTAMVGQRGCVGIAPNGFAITAMGSLWKRVGDTGAPGEITGQGRIDYHIRSTSRIEYAYNDVEA